MRTTLDLDDDVLIAARERARRERSTIGKVVSDLAREALTGSVGSDEEGAPEFLGFRPLPHRGGVVTNDLIDRLRQEHGV